MWMNLPMQRHTQTTPICGAIEHTIVDEIEKDLLQLDRRELTLRFFPPGLQNEA